MVLTCQNIKMSFLDEVLFQDVSFQVREHEKVALVGPNGCGKSTLLKIITSELSPTEGSVFFGKDVSVGYLAQYQDVSSKESIYNHVLHANQKILDMEVELTSLEKSMEGLKKTELEKVLNEYHKKNHTFDLLGGNSYRSEVVGVLKGLGFSEDEFEKKLNELSGGQKTRVNLARLLMQKPDFLILDEPINHLDLAAIEWLEGFLQNYKGAVLIVAHDRFFLDHIVETVIDMSFKTAKVYKGNYSAFSQQKREYMITRQREYENQQKEIAHQQAVIDKLKSYNREKSVKRAESREKKLEKMELLEKLVEQDTSMRISLEPDTVSGKDVLSMSHLKKSFGEKTLFKDISFEIHRGERVALIGDNGTGKTTILKILNEIYQPDAGVVKVGTGVTMSYYDQEQQELNEENTLFEELQNAYSDLNNTKIRNVLAAFLFTKDDAFKKIKSLSGGERGRISLAKLMLSGANFLVLDEPTNHLDMDSKDILENAIKSYSGTVFYVSHDRYFINQTATRVLELRDGQLFQYLGNYDYYLSKKDERVYQSEVEKKDDKIQEVSETKLSWEEQKKAEAKKRKRQNEINKIEKEIEELETKISKIDEQYLDPEISKNSARLNELAKERETLENRLMECMDTWEELSC